MVKTHAENVKCFACADEARLTYIEINEFACNKCLERIEKLLKRLRKGKRPRKSIEATKET